MSQGPGQLGRRALRNILEHGFAGEVLHVGARGSAVSGVRSVASMEELPSGLDLVLVDTPPECIERALRVCALSAASAVIVLSRTAESDVIRTLSREFPRTRFIGPGSHGLIIPGLRLNASLTAGMPLQGGLAVVSSAPELWGKLLCHAKASGFGLSHLICVGGQSDVDLADVIDYLRGRGRVRALLVHVDSMPPADAFLPAVWAFARDRPLITWKSGSAWERVVFSSAMRRAAAVPLEDMEHLGGLVELLARLERVPLGGRICVLVPPGPEEEARGDAELSVATRVGLRAWGCTLRPGEVRCPGLGDRETLLEVSGALLRDPGVHMLAMRVPGEADGRLAAALGVKAARRGRVLAGVSGDPASAAAVRGAGLPVYTSLADAVRALGYLADYVRNLEDLHRPWGPLPERPAAGASYALPCGDIEGFPLEDVLRRWGIVVAGHAPRSGAHTFSVELRHHPEFGRIILARTLDGRRCPPVVGLPPLTGPAARSLLAELPGDLPSRVVEQMVILLLRLSRLAFDVPALVELKLERVAATVEGAVALGARARVDAAALGPHLCLCPYPEERTQTVQIKDGTRVTLRPVRPDDGPRWRRMLARSSPDSLRLRYHSVHHEASRRMALRHCCIDYRREWVVVAEVGSSGLRTMVGEGELFTDPDRELAEFAVFVSDPWQGRGLGGHLTDLMVQRAVELGSRRVACEMTPDNVRMMRLLKRRGFDIRIVVEDGVAFAERRLR